MWAKDEIDGHTVPNRDTGPPKIGAEFAFNIGPMNPLLLRWNDI